MAAVQILLHPSPSGFACCIIFYEFRRQSTSPKKKKKKKEENDNEKETLGAQQKDYKKLQVCLLPTVVPELHHTVSVRASLEALASFPFGLPLQGLPDSTDPNTAFLVSLSESARQSTPWLPELPAFTAAWAVMHHLLGLIENPRCSLPPAESVVVGPEQWAELRRRGFPLAFREFLRPYAPVLCPGAALTWPAGSHTEAETQTAELPGSRGQLERQREQHPLKTSAELSERGYPHLNCPDPTEAPLVSITDHPKLTGPLFGSPCSIEKPLDAPNGITEQVCSLTCGTLLSQQKQFMGPTSVTGDTEKSHAVELVQELEAAKAEISRLHSDLRAARSDLAKYRAVASTNVIEGVEKFTGGLDKEQQRADLSDEGQTLRPIMEILQEIELKDAEQFEVCPVCCGITSDLPDHLAKEKTLALPEPAAQAPEGETQKATAKKVSVMVHYYCPDKSCEYCDRAHHHHHPTAKEGEGACPCVSISQKYLTTSLYQHYLEYHATDRAAATCELERLLRKALAVDIAAGQLHSDVHTRPLCV